LDPPLKTPDDQQRLEGFRWLPELRPVRQQEERSEGLKV
jgi:hypothetical protein